MSCREEDDNEPGSFKRVLVRIVNHHFSDQWPNLRELKETVHTRGGFEEYLQLAEPSAHEQLEYEYGVPLAPFSSIFSDDEISTP
jgi:hypothetical protein